MNGNTNEPNALARVEQLPKWAAEVVTPFADPSRFELLLPALPVNSSLGYGHVPSVSIVSISPNPLDGEVFKVGSRKAGSGWENLFSYTKPALLKMASAAGISINTARVDRKDDRDYCEVKAIGAMKNESGQNVIRSATKAFDVKDVSAEAWRVRLKRNEEQEPKKRKHEDALRQDHEAEMTAFRKHLVRRTEAGAISAVIRELLGIKGSLTAAQVAKPKVILRVDFRPDASDPVVKRFLLERSESATLSLYGIRSADPMHGGSGAEIVEIAADDEPAKLEAPEALESPASPAAEAPALPSAEERDFSRLVIEGFDVLGVSADMRARILSDSRGDMREAYRMLNEWAQS